MAVVQKSVLQAFNLDSRAVTTAGSKSSRTRNVFLHGSSLNGLTGTFSFSSTFSTVARKPVTVRSVQLNEKPATTAVTTPKLEALIFDCDGVILESEDLHRRAYNATFQNFKIRRPGSTDAVHWSEEFYDMLQNKIGGGKPKMRWYFNETGWPISSILGSPPTSDESKEALIDALQEWKTNKYQEMIGSGEVAPRPGVLALMDEARRQGIKIAVCSAATKSSVVFCLQHLLGEERFSQLDCFLAGDDVAQKKPDPTIYSVALQKLGLAPSSCLVVEDSMIGLQAATGAGIPCVITHTPSTKDQKFYGAAAVYPNLSSVTFDDLVALQQALLQ